MCISCARASIPIPEEGRRREERGTRGCESGERLQFARSRLTLEVEGKGGETRVDEGGMRFEDAEALISK